jgi:hypothetical protein
MKRKELMLVLALLLCHPLISQTDQVWNAFEYNGQYFATNYEANRILRLEPDGTVAEVKRFTDGEERSFRVSPTGQYVAAINLEDQIVTIINLNDGSSKDIKLLEQGVFETDLEYGRLSENARYLYSENIVWDLTTGAKLSVSKFESYHFVSDVDGYFIDLEVEPVPGSWSGGIKRPVYRSLKTGEVVYRLDKKYRFYYPFGEDKIIVYTHEPFRYSIFDYPSKKVINVPFDMERHMNNWRTIGDFTYLVFDEKHIKWNRTTNTFIQTNELPEFMKEEIVSVSGNKVLNFTMLDFEIMLVDAISGDLLQQWTLKK